MTSKVCIIRDNIAVAWTGQQIVCRDFLRFIDSRLTASPHFAEFERVCLEYDHKSNATIVGAIASQGQIFSFSIDLEKLTIKRGRKFIDGSGGTHFSTLINRDPYLENKNDEKKNQNKLGIGKLGLWALHQASELTFLEALGWPTLENSFGCGYDIALMIRNKFYRISSISTVVYIIQRRPEYISNTVLNVCPLEAVFTQRYNRDGTILLRKDVLDLLNLKNQAGSYLMVTATEERVVKPIIDEKKYRVIKPTADFLRIVYLFPFKTGGAYQRAVVVRLPNDIFNIILLKNGKDGSLMYFFKISSQFLNNIDVMLKDSPFPWENWAPFERGPGGKFLADDVSK